MTEAIYQKRRQRVFFVLSGMFLGTLAMLNILGVTRFLDFSFTLFGIEIPMIVAVGVLPYPVTFMCTDLISELFGEEKARDMVFVGLLLNAWVVFLLWLGSVLPGASRYFSKSKTRHLVQWRRPWLLILWRSFAMYGFFTG